jgi:hypothetical protein
MGAHASPSPHNSHFSLEDWEAVSLTAFTDIKDPAYGSNFKIYANKLNPSL